MLNARLLDMCLTSGADLSVAGDEFKRPDHQALHALPVNPQPGARPKSKARLHFSTPDEENYMEFGALACHQLHRIWRDPDLWEHEEEYNRVRVMRKDFYSYDEDDRTLYKGVVTVSASIADVLNVLYATYQPCGDSVWDPTMLSSRLIKAFDASHQIRSCIRKLMPMMANRQFIYFFSHRQFDDGTVVLVEKSFKTGNGAEFHKFDDQDSVLGSMNLSGFVLAENPLRSLRDGRQRTTISYFCEIDPAGFVPTFVKERINRDRVMMLEEIQGLAERRSFEKNVALRRGKQ